MDDSDAVREFQRTEDPAAFQVLVTRHQTRVFRLAVSILGPGLEGEAEEVTQEVFVRVFRQLRNFRGESKFSTWLYRIAYNQALDLKKRARFRLPHYSEEALTNMPAERRSGNPFEAALDTERRALLRDCLDQLPHLYRSVLHLYYWMGCSVEEIGEQLGTTAGTVKSYLYRARQRLHALLKKKGVAHV